jgi:hypothetical protein
MASTPGKSWILTGSLENFRINAELLRERLSAAVLSRA